MFRRFPLFSGAAGAAIFASHALAATDAVNSIQFSDGNVLAIQGIYGSGTNTAYEVVQFTPTVSYAWEYRWTPGTSVSAYAMVQAITGPNPTIGGIAPEHYVTGGGFTYNGYTTSGYSPLFYGTYSKANVSPSMPQGTSSTYSAYAMDSLILTDDPTSVSAYQVALPNGSFVQWGTYSADYSSAFPPALPETAAPISIATGVTTTAATDSDLGNAAAGLSFDGGKIAVTNSFNTARQVTISPAGGTIDVAAIQTFGFGGDHLLTWAGALAVTNSGSVAISQSGPVSVSPGSSLNIATGSHVIVTGTADPFTDSFTPGSHVAIINNGAFTLDANSVIASLTGNGNTIIGDGVNPIQVQIAPGNGPDSAASLVILDGASLDITNNILDINYPGASPISLIQGYISSGKIFSSLSDKHHSVGYLDNGSTVEFEYALDGDTNLDGSVNFNDLLTLAQNYGASNADWTMGDSDGNGSINFADLLALAQNYGQSLNSSESADFSPGFASEWNLAVSETSAVPEPGSLCIGVVGAVGFLMRRRRRIL